jgi:hypothetical protein
VIELSCGGGVVVLKKIKEWFYKTDPKKILFTVIFIAILLVVLGFAFGANYAKSGIILTFDNNFVEFNDQHEWVWSFILSIVSIVLVVISILIMIITVYYLYKSSKGTQTQIAAQKRSLKLAEKELRQNSIQLKMTQESIEYSLLVPLDIDIYLNPNSLSLTPKHNSGFYEAKIEIEITFDIKNKGFDLAQNINCYIHFEGNKYSGDFIPVLFKNCKTNPIPFLIKDTKNITNEKHKELKQADNIQDKFNIIFKHFFDMVNDKILTIELTYFNKSGNFHHLSIGYFLLVNASVDKLIEFKPALYELKGKQKIYTHNPYKQKIYLKKCRFC